MSFSLFLAMTLIIFAIYLFVLLIIFGFIAIVILHIGEFREYSRYLSVVLKIYLIAVVVIAIFGWYKVLTDDTPSLKSSTTKVEKIDF